MSTEARKALIRVLDDIGEAPDSTERRRLPRNMANVIPMMKLGDAEVSDVTAMLNHVPTYSSTEWRRLIANAVGAIHQLPRLLKAAALPNLDLKDIEAYFGRSSASAMVGAEGINVHNRFQAGIERGHHFGMVFAQTTIAASLRFERFGISLIDQLKQVDGLCISNRTFSSRGRVGSTEPGYLYMTFRLIRGDEHANQLSQGRN